MKLAEAKNTYSGQWIAFQTKEEGDNPEGEVLLHDKDRRQFDQVLLAHNWEDIYITFAGEATPEQYAVMF